MIPIPPLPLPPDNRVPSPTVMGADAASARDLRIDIVADPAGMPPRPTGHRFAP
jgi:hypothetical protein